MFPRTDAISIAAGIPLPETSPTMSRQAAIVQFENIVIVAADDPGGLHSGLNRQIIFMENFPGNEVELRIFSAVSDVAFHIRRPT